LKSIDRGMILCAQGSETLTNSFTAEFYLLARSEGGRSKPINNNGYIQQLFSTTWDIACRIDLGKIQLINCIHRINFVLY
jgi:elongation factor Tu